MSRCLTPYVPQICSRFVGWRRLTLLIKSIGNPSVPILSFFLFRITRGERKKMTPVRKLYTFSLWFMVNVKPWFVAQIWNGKGSLLWETCTVASQLFKCKTSVARKPQSLGIQERRVPEKASRSPVCTQLHGKRGAGPASSGHPGRRSWTWVCVSVLGAAKWSGCCLPNVLLVSGSAGPPWRSSWEAKCFGVIKRGSLHRGNQFRMTLMGLGVELQ